MLVRIGTNNPLKVEALREVLLELGVPHVLESENIPSGVPSQPIGFDEITRGAQTRALRCRWEGTDLSIGVESGVFITSPLYDNWYDITCAYVFDRKLGLFSGFSSAFQLPGEVVTYLRDGRDEDVTLNDAYQAVGLTSDPKLGNSLGAASIETGGHFTRKDQIKQALICALGKRFPVDSSRTS